MLPSPHLVIRAGAGLKVEVKYLAGDEEAAFDLMRRALPALEALNRVARPVSEAAREGLEAAP